MRTAVLLSAVQDKKMYSLVYKQFLERTALTPVGLCALFSHGIGHCQDATTMVASHIHYVQYLVTQQPVTMPADTLLRLRCLQKAPPHIVTELKEQNPMLKTIKYCQV